MLIANSPGAPDFQDNISEWHVNWIEEFGSSPTPINGIRSIAKIKGSINQGGYFFAVVSQNNQLYFCTKMVSNNQNVCRMIVLGEWVD